MLNVFVRQEVSSMASKIGKNAQITAAHLTNRRSALQRDILQWSHVQAVYMPEVAIARSTGDFSFEEPPDMDLLPDEAHVNSSNDDSTAIHGKLDGLCSVTRDLIVRHSRLYKTGRTSTRRSNRHERSPRRLER
jgi:hypothetical protein